MTVQEMSQNLPERFSVSRHPNHLLLAGVNNRNNPTIPWGPCSCKSRIFLAYWLYISTVSTFLIIRASYHHVSPSGLAWDWVGFLSNCTMGHHGAVLGDAVVCQVLETRNAIYITMGKFSCCVPGRTNNWRNSPNMKFHTSPTEPKVKKTSYD